MFSFTGDTVLDPFCGTGTTLVAAANTARNGIGIELDVEYARMAAHRLKTETGGLFNQVKLQFQRADELQTDVLREEPGATVDTSLRPTEPVTYRKRPRKSKRSGG
jgi:site-specific DNA-methyltransferase (adenine-specific)